MKPLIINDSGESVPERFLSDWIGRAAKALNGRGVLSGEALKQEISLVFLQEIDAKNLNWNYRQKDYATDILAFPTDDPESFGELVMCPLVLKKQAKANKHSEEHEMGYMVLHGILHLLGYDHEADEASAHAMFRLQDEVFEELTRPPRKEKSVKKASVAVKAPKKNGASMVKKARKAAPKKAVKKVSGAAGKKSSKPARTRAGARA